MAIRQKTFIWIIALALAGGLSADAFARAGKGGSFGSRGARTWSAPPSTATAPQGGSMFERSMTPNQGQYRPNFGQQAPQRRGGLFSGFGGGLLGGLLGAGLIGMLFGHGFGGGLGGMMSFIGLLLQLALLFFLVRFALNWFRNRNLAAQGAGPAAGGPTGGPSPFGFNRQGGMFGGSGPFGGAFAGGGAARARPAQQKLELAPADFSMFERRLQEIQGAYSAQDMDRLRALTSPEMAASFSGELAEDARRGVVNTLSNVQFLQGDLSEAWREPNADYATVAMRFSLIDATYDRATGRLVGGDPSTPQQATELWTFSRRPGSGPDGWTLSGIQQA